MAFDDALAGRVRELVTAATGGAFAEKRMFGGLAFLVDGHMAVAASREGGLLARVTPEDHAALLSGAHVSPMQMRGRPVEGWLRVAADGVATQRELEPWVSRCVACARSLPRAG